MMRRVLTTARRTSLLRCHSKPLLVPSIVPTRPVVVRARSIAASGPSEMVGVAAYEDVKAAGRDNKTYLIDVREPQELQETGKIPGSINIPLKNVEDTLKNASTEDFERKFGRAKPGLDAPIIFTCRSGRRSLVALKMAEKLGFTNLRNFEGGWLLWESKLGGEKAALL